MAEGFGEDVMDIHLRNFIDDVNIINYDLPCPEHVTGETLRTCHANILENNPNCNKTCTTTPQTQKTIQSKSHTITIFLLTNK